MRNSLLVSLILAMTPFAIRAQLQQSGPVRFEHTRRPLSEGADLLESRFGWVVTYEDVPVVGVEVEDITAKVRPLEPDRPNRTLIPKAQPFIFQLDEATANQPGGVGAPAVIAALVAAYNASGNPGQFRAVAVRVPNGRMVFHVVPFQKHNERN